jgi:transcriptional regulator with XRE-family HTH domain
MDERAHGAIHSPSESGNVSDQIRMRRIVAGAGLLARVRRAAGLSQDELARRAGTSRTAVSAYEHGRKSPALDTVDRLVSAAGYVLDAWPRVEFVAVSGGRGREVLVPTRLPQLPAVQALATVELPLTLNWSQLGRKFRLIDRGERARVYELVLREGAAADVLRYIDGTLLVDLWEELVLPRAVRAAWLPLIDQIRDASDVSGVAS